MTPETKSTEVTLIGPQQAIELGFPELDGVWWIQNSTGECFPFMHQGNCLTVLTACQNHGMQVRYLYSPENQNQPIAGYVLVSTDN